MTNTHVGQEFQTLTRSIAESFLQTAVVLDDLASMPLVGLRTREPEIAGEILEPDFPQSTSPPGEETIGDASGVPLDAEAVIDGFAKVGSVCAVLKANLGEEYQARTAKAARRADIVILDWKIHDSMGEETLTIVEEILNGDAGGGRLRLIAIYTGEPDLQGIFEQVRDAVERFYEGEELKVWDDDLRLSKGPLHVVVLAKPGTASAALPELQHQEVSEGSLADRLVDEFALLTGGLIRNVAMAGIARIRDNSHDILAKFDPSLDPAYLGHRLLLPHPPESEDHLVESLGSEVLSLLEGYNIGAGADLDAIESWLTHSVAQGLNLSDPFPLPPRQDNVRYWRELLAQGFDAPGLPPPQGISKTKLREQATEPFAEAESAASIANRRFSALLALMTRFPGQLAQLSLGTVVSIQTGENREYFLCLQPKCDSVRLKGPTGFPFIPLNVLKNARVSTDGMQLRLTIENENESWLDLGIVTKPSELRVKYFQPSTEFPGVVTASAEPDGQLYFSDTAGYKYRWLAVMKNEHALGIANEIAAALSRPGPNNAEWLRRSAGSTT